MQSVVFSLDQCVPGGFLANPDPDRLRRVVDSVAPLQQSGKYEVSFLVTLSYPDWSRKDWLLDSLADMGANYALDVASSDNIALRIQPWHCPYDAGHGISSTIQQVISLKQRHGPRFVGIRCHEMLTMDWIIRQGRAGSLDWWKGFTDLAPIPGDFYRPELLYPFLSYAHGSGLWICWSEPRWDAYTYAVVRGFTDHYPGSVIPTYANNVDRGTEYSYWNSLSPAFDGATRGWGLSDQAWGLATVSADPRSAPGADLARWAVEALNAGCVLVEFEPAGDFWNLPIVWEPLLPSHDGSPTDKLQTVITALLAR